MAKVVSLGQFERVLVSLEGDMRQAVVKGLRSSGLYLEGVTVEEIDRAEPDPAVDRGQLRDSVGTRSTPGGAVVEVKAPHAPMIEYGTRPFFPPIEPLARWAMRKGLADDEEEAQGIAFAIAKKISQTGIFPRGYFHKAWNRLVNERIVSREVNAELEIMRRKRSS